MGPSPAWLSRRLATVGIAAINNVVDITNYVLMECGQPLHAFDLAGLKRGQIVVREGRPGETLVAIDHRSYDARPGMCVIADAERAVGVGGVMGGPPREVSDKHARCADRGGGVRSAVDPHDRAALELAQRFVVSLRARARSRRESIGPAGGRAA